MKTIRAWLALPFEILAVIRSIDGHLGAIRKNLNDVSRRGLSGRGEFIATDEPSMGNHRFDR